MSAEIGVGESTVDKCKTPIVTAEESYSRADKKAISLWIETLKSRAGPGDIGVAESGANYVASLLAQNEALIHHCDQVIFLDAVEHRWIEDLVGMNVFFVFDDERVITTPLIGTSQPAVARASIIDLLKAHEVDVSEEPYTIDAWRADAASGRLSEAFACKNSAVIAPIGEVKARSGHFLVGNGEAGPVTAWIKGQLVNIRRGNRQAPNGWVGSLDTQEAMLINAISATR